MGFLFNLDVQVETAAEAAPADSVGAEPQLQLQAKGLQERKAAQNLSYSAPTEGVRWRSAARAAPRRHPRSIATEGQGKNKNRQKAKQQRKSRKKNR